MICCRAVCNGLTRHCFFIVFTPATSTYAISYRRNARHAQADDTRRSSNTSVTLW